MALVIGSFVDCLPRLSSARLVSARLAPARLGSLVVPSGTFGLTSINPEYLMNHRHVLVCMYMYKFIYVYIQAQVYDIYSCIITHIHICICVLCTYVMCFDYSKIIYVYVFCLGGLGGARQRKELNNHARDDARLKHVWPSIYS